MPDGSYWIEQNPAKQSRSGRLAREGHQIAWEFSRDTDGYTGRLLVDGEILDGREAARRYPRTR